MDRKHKTKFTPARVSQLKFAALALGPLAYYSITDHFLSNRWVDLGIRVIALFIGLAACIVSLDRLFLRVPDWRRKLRFNRTTGFKLAIAIFIGVVAALSFYGVAVAAIRSFS